MLMQSYLCTHTMKLGCRLTNSTSKNFSQITLPLDTGQSSNLIKSFGRNSQGMLNLPSMMSSQTSHSFSDHSIQLTVHGSLEGREVIPKSATGSIWGLHTPTAVSGTSAISVLEIIEELHAPKTVRRKEERVNEWRRVVRDPQYLQGFVWGEEELSTPSATLTLFKKPLPSIPEDDLKHKWVTNTIHEYPYLFKVVSPICNDSLRLVLQTHPNHPFVDSILSGFQDGFWPAARPDMLISQQHGHDNCRQDESWDDVVKEFLRNQHAVEICLDQFSQPFRPNLLP